MYKYIKSNFPKVLNASDILLLQGCGVLLDNMDPVGNNGPGKSDMLIGYPEVSSNHGLTAMGGTDLQQKRFLLIYIL